jgi:endogenous inhibitor of DNA gyrase (YacG/DUF329 family)
MATSTGKTIGLILLVVLILILALRLTPLILAPFGIFPGISKVICTPKLPNIGGIDFGPFGFFKFTFISILSFALLALWILVIVWVYRDAERRSMNGVLWALLVFIGNLIGLLIYLIVRSDVLPSIKSAPPTKPCPECQKPVELNFAFCPHCGARLQLVCPGCRQPVEKSWKICPHCGTKLTEPKNT